MTIQENILKDLQERAALKGGRCLSKEYINNRTALQWQCQKGHTWDTTSTIIKRGSWCPACASMSSRKLTIEQMHTLAKSRGGKFLSKEYINIRTKYDWQCKEGHIWRTKPGTIKGGCWCPHCGGVAEGSIEGMRQIAKNRGGKCLSKKYTNSYTSLLWQCKKGHTWKAKPGAVKHKSWCPVCRLNKGSIELMQQIAKSKGGKCLSEKYTDNKTHLLWQCKKGHTWKSIPLNITRGSWCPHCLGRVLTIEHIQTLAKSKGGKCSSKKYINTNTKLSWQCKEGHIWETRPNDIKQGSWCPYCTGSVKNTIEQMQQLAKSRGGKCLSKEYINSNTKLSWQCKEGHKWETVPSVIKDGSWCPHCAGKVKGTIEQMRQLAKSKGGKCLSKEYINTYTKLKWQCKKGHKWETAPAVIKDGKWCAHCSGVAKLTIEEMQQLAKSRGGKCLSKKYAGNKTYLLWQCSKEHTWEASPNAVKRGNWCPHCAGKAKGSIEQMHQVAKSRGGKCLSEEYINNSTKLNWQCKKGHIWEAKPNKIKTGTWCPVCSRIKKVSSNK